MKKVIFLITMTSLISTSVLSQINRPDFEKKKSGTTQTKSTTTTTQPPAPVYSLTAVKANIRTGSDNKEYPSVVYTFLKSRSGTAGAIFRQENLKTEMKVNSNTEFGMEKSGNGNMTLTDAQSQGLQFEVWYFANFQFDAWKIEGISVTLEFRDQNGNLHPTYGQKTIAFANASGFLNRYGDHKMICTTDGYFNPLSSQITQ